MLELLLQSAITLGAVALGWFLNERSRRSRENKAALGRALTTLILFRRRLAGIKFVASKMVDLAPQVSTTQLQIVFNQLMPRTPVFDKEFADAVYYLAGLNPMLALTVYVAGLRANYDLPLLTPGTEPAAAFDEVATRLLDPSALDEAIEWLAELHGRKTLKDVLQEIGLQNQPDAEFEALIQLVIPFDKRAGPPTKP